METISQARYMPRRCSFLNFLRGMETTIFPDHFGGSADFLNFLRGMETRGTSQDHPIPAVLPKLP